MKCLSRNRWPWLPLTVAMLLSACGGGGGDAPPSATLSAAPDAATLAWRSSTDVDVLANDSASQGGLTLTAVGTPAHGTATIVDGRVRYTPAAGWFGTDSVTYTVRAVEGGATATATLTLTVQAQLVLSGTITDAPVANAAVTLRVGAQTLTTTADAQGRYQLSVTSSDPTAWVQLSGASVDGRVRLVSLVGELAGLAARADAGTGAVGPLQASALNATHWTSADAALRARALGGALPNTAQAMTATDVSARGAELSSLATVVRMIADVGASLPSGSADSFALLLNREASAKFIADQVAVDSGEAFRLVRTAVLADAPAVSGEPWVADQERLFTTLDTNPVTYADLVFTLRPGGSATIRSHGVEGGAATWTAQGGTLELVYATPVTLVNLYTWDGDGQTYSARTTYTGFRLQLVSGDSRRGTVLRLDRSRTEFIEGPATGQLVFDSSNDPGWPVQVMDVATRLGVQADELTVGRRLAGLTLEGPNEAGLDREDILRIDGPGTGSFELSGRAATWTFADGWLTVNAEGLVSRRYTRLLRDPATGLESWLGATVPADPATPAQYFEADMLFAEAGLAFTADTAARRWRSEGYLVANPDVYGTGSSYTLNPDGSSTQIVERWSLRADGTVDLFRVRPEGEYPRRWIPLRRVGNHWVILETVDFSYVGTGITWRMNWLYDLGPAVP
jgi:hypothetical protein